MVIRTPALGQPLPPFTRRDLPTLGLTRHQLDALLQRGSVCQPLRGVYLDARSVDDPRARAVAAGMNLPAGAAVAHRCAAWLHGIDSRGPGELGRPLPLECVVPVGSTVPQRRGLVARQADLPDDDVVELLGVPVISAERTACDLARYLPPFMGLAALDALAHAGSVEPAELASRIEQWAGDRFVDRARRLIRLCEPATESFGESWLRLRVVDAGFPRPEPQIPVLDGDGIARYRLDMGWRRCRAAVEYDGEEFHSTLSHWRHDAQRRERLAREFGWTVIGVGKSDALGQSLRLERGIGELLGLGPDIRRRLW